jgi:hypothetical protein
MSQEIFNQAEKFFEKKEEWYSFLNLWEYRDGIFWNWFAKCKQELNRRFQDIEIDERNKWLFVSWGNFDFKWYLEECGTDSLGIYLQNSIFQLYANGNLYDVEEITKLLQQKKYAPIAGAFERQDEICPGNSWAKVLERGNFRFGDDYDGHFDNPRLAWYANFKTEEFADQIVRKVNRFRNNEEITNLILEINEKTKKQQ